GPGIATPFQCGLGGRHAPGTAFATPSGSTLNPGDNSLFPSALANASALDHAPGRPEGARHTPGGRPASTHALAAHTAVATRPRTRRHLPGAAATAERR